MCPEDQILNPKTNRCVSLTSKKCCNGIDLSECITPHIKTIQPKPNRGGSKQYVVYNHRKQKSIVYTDSKQRKFIKINKVHMYLDNIRGQYI